jgi:hypothetical protein
MPRLLVARFASGAVISRPDRAAVVQQSRSILFIPDIKSPDCSIVFLTLGTFAWHTHLAHNSNRDETFEHAQPDVTASCVACPLPRRSPIPPGMTCAARTAAAILLDSSRMSSGILSQSALRGRAVNS